MSKNLKKREGKSGMQIHKLWSRGLAMTLCICMILGSVDLTAFAGTGTGQTDETETIVSVTPLADDVANQSLTVGEDSDNIVFPESLTVQVQKTLDNADVPDDVTSTETETVETTESEEADDEHTTETSDLESTIPTGSSEENSDTVDDEAILDMESVDTQAENADEVEVQNVPEAVELPEIEVPQASDAQTVASSDSETEQSQADENEVINDKALNNEETQNEPKYMIEDVNIAVQWKLNKEKSSNAELSTETAGNVYVFQPEMSDEYVLADGVALPEITVQIETPEEIEFEQSVTIDGVIITVSAEKGVFPADAVLSVEKIADQAKLEELADAADKADGIDEAEIATQSMDEKLDGLYAFDISILDKEGNEIQPDTEKGQVHVSFTNPEPEQYEAAEISVYHVDEATGEAENLDTNIKNEEEVEVETNHFSPFVLRVAKSNDTITLYSGGGEIVAAGWVETSTKGMYMNVDDVTSFPEPTMYDDGTKFDGWYADKNYWNKANVPEKGHTYYAKWTRKSMVVTGNSMKYTYGSTIDAKGLISGKEISTTFMNGGYQLYVKPNDANAKDGGTTVYANGYGDVFQKVDNDLYVAQVASFEGSFVRFSYYVWNKGESTVSNFNMGMAVDVQIDTNDKAELQLSSDSCGKYVSMKDGNKALRLYYEGDYVSDVSTLWTGKFSKHSNNVFNNNRKGQKKIDSTMALSWKNITIPANGVVVKSFLLGCGDAGNLTPTSRLFIDPNGDRVMQEYNLASGEIFTVPTAPVKRGSVFLGWNTISNGSGKTYMPGDTLSINSTTSLYSQWYQIESTAEISLLKDEAAWTGQTVQLYQDGKKKYDLSEKNGSGVYKSNKVINGTYDVYVNGRKSDKQITIDADQDAVTVKDTVAYQELHLTVNVDDQPDIAAGEVTLRKNNKVVYTLSSRTGYYNEVIQESEGSYDIFIDGNDTEYDISAIDSTKTIDFYTANVKITDDSAWTDARVELRDPIGNLVAVLASGTVEGNSVIYEKILQKNADETLALYVDNRDVHKNFVVKTGACSAELTYYTASVTIKGEVPSPVVSMTNGVENYDFELAGDHFETQHVLLNHDNGEQDYIVSVQNTIDINKAAINSQNKSAILQYWTVNYYTVTSDGDDRRVRTVYVHDQSTMPAYTGTVKLSAYTFSHWSETKWTTENTTGGVAFDFSQPITKNVNLYANYATPTVTIGELVYTDADGVLGGTGTYYRMGNLTISGFDPGNESIKYIYLTTTNTENIKLMSTEGISVMNGSTAVSTNGESVSFKPATDKVAITFNTAVSMAEAQDFLRNQIVVKPKTGVEHTMLVMVTDKGGKYVAANAVSGTQTSTTYKKLSGTNNGSTSLSSGVYYVMDNTTYTGSAANSGLRIASGATVYIYVAPGKTLTATGGNASGRSGAGAGIEVPSNATLVLLGEGKVVAKGGNAAKGGDGETGTAGYASANNYRGGSGGAGGYGGGGAGAGIGGAGGYGGYGGSATGNGSTLSSGDNNYDGVRGNNGGSGGNGNAGGTVYVLDKIQLTATGGSGASGGSGKSAGSSDYSNTKVDGKQYHTAGGGGGGAGGGGGYSARDIGSGGPAGGGGGSGGRGGVDYAKDTYHNSNTNALMGSAGGTGGSGYGTGGSGSGAKDTGEYAGSWKQIGADGGSGGSSGSYASNGNCYVASTAKKNNTSGTYYGDYGKDSRSYSIMFDTPSDTATKPASKTYTYNKEYTLTFPDYTDSDPDRQFLGWQLKNYAKSGVEGSVFTKNDSTRYKEGDTVTIPATTYGNISFVAVTEVVAGVRDEDTTKTTIPENGEKLTYYTYKVTLEMNHAVITKGNIRIGDTTVAPSADGSYILVSKDKTTYDITVDGAIVGTTNVFGSGSLENISETVIEYEQLKVLVTGKAPESVTLTGSGAPLLVDMGSTSAPYEYSKERIVSPDKGTYKVFVDGEDTGFVVSYGETVTVAYNTVTVHINVNGVDASSVKKVELKDEAGKTLSATRNSNGDYTCTKVQSDKKYTVYVNGEKTDKITDFSKSQTVEVDYSRYTTVVKTELDGVLTDMGTVLYGNTKMVRTGNGTYQLITTDNQDRQLLVDGNTVKTAVVPGNEITVHYYTVTYAVSDNGSGVEAGTLPEDSAWYLEGSNATILANEGLTNGQKTFAGWRIGDKVYQPGEDICITETTIAKAVWNQTDIQNAEIEFSEEQFVYNGESQIPDVTVKVNGVTLTGEDYSLTYKNSNTVAGRYDAAGTALNAINAGTVTVAVTGEGDYTGTVSKEYTILPKTITIQNLKAVNRVYDGTTDVQLTTADAYLEGIVDGDDVSIIADSHGQTYSENARDGKSVIVNSEAQLTGTASSNYELETAEPLTVDFAKKPLTAEMFHVSDVVYNGTAQTPEVAATDMAVVDGEKVNIITEDDYSVKYENNVHAGEGTIIISAGRVETDEDGKEVLSDDSNYEGTVTIHFQIEKAPLTITATEAESSFGTNVADVTNNYKVTGTIYTEEDKENLAIKAVTSVKKGYEVNTYKDAVTISYNKDNTDYEVTTKAADYTVTQSDGKMSAIVIGYTGVYDGAEHSIRVIPQSLMADDTAKVYYSTSELTDENYKSASTDNISYKDAGTYKVFYYVASDNYAGYAGSADIKITKATAVVTANTHTITYGDDISKIAASDKAYSGVTITGLAGNDKADSVLKGAISYTSDYRQYGDVGTYTLTPNGLSAQNYDIVYKAGALNVEPKTVTVKWSDQKEFTYTGSEQGISATVDGMVNGDKLAPVYDSAEQNAICNTAVNAGNYTAKVSGLSGSKASDYKLPTDDTVTKEWKINKAVNEWTITPSIQGWTAESDANTPVAAAKFGAQSDIQYAYAEKPADDAAEPEYSATVPTKAGDYLMKATVPGTDNYGELTLETPVEFTIAAKPTEGDEKQTIYVTPENVTIIYGEDKPDSVSVTYTDAKGDTVERETLGLTGDLSYATDYVKGDVVRGNVGTYLLTLTGMTSDTYHLVFKTGTLKVEPKEVSLKWSNPDLTYTGTEQSVTATVEGLVNGDEIFVGTYEGNTATAVGSDYTATAKSLAGANAGNYKLPDNASCSWSITKAENEWTITPSIDSWYYGEDANTPVAAAKFGEVHFSYEKVEINALAKLFSVFAGNRSTTEVPAETGTYKLTATVEAGDGYGKLSQEITFEIKPAEVVVTAQDASGYYGEEIRNPLSYTLSTLKGKISEEEKKALGISLQTKATAEAAAGTYPITVTANNSSNISVETIPGAYQILPIAVTASVSPAEVTYDGKAHGINKPQITTADGKEVTGLDVYYSTEELNSRNYGSGSKTSPAQTDAGALTVYYYAVGENYAPVKGSTTVTVNQKEVTVTANDSIITYGDAAQNAGVKYEGFAGSDNEESLNLTPSYKYLAGNTAYVAGSPVGTYKIVPEGLDTKNYSFLYKEGTMTVEKKALTDEMFTVSSNGLTYDKTAKTPKVTGKDGSLMQESDYTVTCENNVNAGEDTATVIITATDNGNYSGSVTKKFSIAPADITVRAKTAESVYNAAVAEVSYEITSGKVFDGDDLKLQAVTSVKKGYAADTYKDAVTVSYDKSNTNYNVTVNTADYTVTAAALEVTADPYQGVYDGKAHTAEITAKTKKFLTYATIYYSADKEVDASNYTEMSTTKPIFTEAGTHTIYYYAVCDNFEPVSGSVEVVINRAPLTVTAPDTEITYGDDPAGALQNLNSDQLKVTGFVGSDNWNTVFGNSQVTFTTNYKQYEKAGNWKISANGLSAANYDVQTVAGTLTVNPKNITFTWQKDDTFTYDGNAHSVEAEAVSKVRDADDVKPAGYTGNTAIAAGAYTAAVTALAGADAANYTFAENEATAQHGWKIEQAANSFTIHPAINNWTEGNTQSTPYAAAKYGEVVFTYSTEEDGTYTESIPNDAKAGTYWLKATVAETANYKGLEEKKEFMINAKDEAAEIKSITIKVPDKSLVYGDAFDVKALKEADLTITGLAEGETLEDAANGTITFVTDYAQGSRVGTYLLAMEGLTAKDGYEICYETGKVTVSKKTVSLAWGMDKFVYDGQRHSIQAVVNSADLYAGDSINVTGYEYDADSKIQNTATNAGTYTAHAISFAGKNWNNYEIQPESASHTWTITKASSGTTDPVMGNRFTVQPSITGWTYGETPNTPYAEAKFGTPRFEYANAENGTYTAEVPQNAGTWYMRAVVEGTEDYESITSTPVSFEIQKAKVVVSADDIASAYGADLAELTYQVSGNVKAGDDLGIALSTTASKDAKVGEYPITVNYASNANYDVTVHGGIYFITAGTSKLQVTASGYTGEYDGTAHGITVEVKDQDGKDAKGVTVYYSEAELTDSNYGTGSTASPTVTDAGSKTIYYYVASEDSLPVSGSKEIVVTQKNVTVKAENAQIVYGETPVNEGVTYGTFAGTDSAESLGLNPDYQYDYAQYQDAGSYKITPVLTDTKNYHFDLKAGTLTVNPKPVTFIWTGNSFSYDGAVKTTTARAKGLENNDSVSLQYADDKTVNCQRAATDAGEYTAKVVKLVGEKGANYTIAADETTANHDWKITSSNNYMQVEPSISGWTYGETPSEPSAKAAYGTVSFVYSSSMNGTYTAQKPVNAGTYFMKAVVEATENYDYYQSKAVSFTIAKAQIRVVADDITAKAGSERKELTYTMYGAEVEGDPISVELSTTVTETSPKGKYPIAVKVTASDNYSVTTEDGIYNILDEDMKLDVTAVGVNSSYDGKDHGITVDVTGDDAQNVNVYYSTTKITDISEIENASKISPVRKMPGTTNVYYYVVKDGEVVANGSKSIIITKAPLTIKANDKTINKGQMPANDGVTYEGFVEGEDADSLTGTLTFNYTYSKGQPDGIYSILPAGLQSANYKITYVPGTLTVLPVQEDVAISGVYEEKGLVYDGNTHAGYEGTPEIEGGGVTEFDIVYRDQDGNKLSGAPKDAGNYTVTISVPKDNVYYKGERVISFTIAKKDIVIRALDQAILAGQKFVALKPVYTGFIGDDNKDDIAIKTLAEVQPESGADLTQAGTIVLKVTSVGELTDEAAKNYQLASETVDGELTVIAKAADGEKPETGGSVKLDDPNSGTIQTAVIKKENELPHTELETNLSVPVAEALLDTDEIDQVKAGVDALIYLVLANADETEHAEEIAAIREKVQNTDAKMIIGALLDLSLYKKVGDNEPKKITQTGNTEVTVYITLSEELKLKDTTKTRTYYIVREHEGVTDIITPALDGDVLSFQTSKFSTYAIAYKDTDKSSGGGDNPGGGNTPGGGTTPGGGDNPGGGNTPGSGDNQGGGNTSGGSTSGGNNTSNTPNGSNQSGTSVSPDGSNPSQSDGTQNDSGLTAGGNNGHGTGTGITPANSGKKPSGNKTNGSNENGSKENGKTPDQVASADNDSKKDNASTDSKNDKQGQEDAKNADSGQTSVAETIEKPSKNVEKQLKDAFAQIKKLDSEIQSGPYVQIDASNIEFGKNNNDGKVKFTLNIPEDIVADGRTFYLVTVDSEGNIVVLQNESLEDGVFSATGDPDATYQIVYEDGESTLAELVSEDGSLMDTNGNVISVKTVNTCFWHWIIAVLALIGVVLTLLARKKKQAMIVAAIDTVLMLVCVILGSCRWDIVTMLIGVVLLAAGIFIRTRRTSREVR